MMANQIEVVARVLMSEAMSSFKVNERLVKTGAQGEEFDCVEQGEIVWTVTKKGQ